MHSVHFLKQEGLIDGIEEGKRKIVQSGFDEGYKIAFEYFHKINFLIGFIE